MTLKLYILRSASHNVLERRGELGSLVHNRDARRQAWWYESVTLLSFDE